MKRENFRKFLTSGGKLVLAGKSAENNEELIRQAKPDEIVLHTKSAGSPFVNIKEPGKNATKQDIKEAAIFCAKHSQAWKKSKTKRDVEVHYFLGKDICKDKDMKTGTFRIRKFKKITAKKSEIEKS